MKKLFKIISHDIAIAKIKEENLALSYVWRVDGKETSKEEFPFENFNNMLLVMD
tara:strand:+ start:422 stop:583 length:162 start_codon:yes stop_codon:yes gene_type:complete